jgi:hypothetical protein
LASGVGYGQGVKQVIDFMGDLHPSKYNRPYAWMDPDFLETLFQPLGLEWLPMNFTNSRTEFSFWSLWASPLMMATDPADLSPEKQSIIMNPEVISINQVTEFNFLSILIQFLVSFYLGCRLYFRRTIEKRQRNYWWTALVKAPPEW